jgi:hypothetical protein
MLNVRDYSEERKHQKLNTPNCPTIFLEHHLYVYLSFSVLLPHHISIQSVFSLFLQFTCVEQKNNYHYNSFLNSPFILSIHLALNP